MSPQSSARDLQAKPRAEQVAKDVRRAIRRYFSAEDKIRIVLDRLRGDDSFAELCRVNWRAKGPLHWSGPPEPDRIRRRL